MDVRIMAAAPQRRFIAAVMDENPGYETVGYGGARGGGKTWASSFAAVIGSLKYDGINTLLLRRVLSAADMNLGEEIKSILRMLGVELGRVARGQAQYMTKDKMFRFPNGSLIQLGFCLRDNDWERYQGTEYARIGFEELAQFPERAWDQIGGSNRSPNPNCPARRWGTCNPGGIGHEFVKRRLIEDKTRDRKTLWIPSRLRDAMSVLANDPGYVLRVLRKLPEWQRRQWEEGDWEAVEGAFWSLAPGTVQDVEIPEYADVFEGVDAGFWPSAYAVIWMAFWRDEITGAHRVHFFRELKRHRLNLLQQADETREVEKLLAWHIHARYADPSCWRRLETEDGSGATTAMTWSQRGLVVAPAASNARTAGWMLWRTLMDDGVLTISPTGCPKLLAEMRAAVHDEHSDDIDDRCEDHLSDAARYVLVSTVGINYAKPRRESISDRRARWVKERALARAAKR